MRPCIKTSILPNSHNVTLILIGGFNCKYHLLLLLLLLLIVRCTPVLMYSTQVHHVHIAVLPVEVRPPHLFLPHPLHHQGLLVCRPVL